MEAPGRRPPPFALLEQAFQEGDPEPLRPLLRSDQKLFVVSPSLGLARGYYGPDQVFLMFRDLFRTRATVKFHLAPAEKPRPQDRLQLSAVGRWTYRQSSSREKRVALALTLVRRRGGWDLRELREVP